MDSSPLAAVSLVLLASFLFFFSSAQSSTIGVSYISELLEIQDRERALPHVQVAAARGVLQRLLPSHTSSFEFRIVSKEQCGGESCFIIKNHPSFTRRGAPQILGLYHLVPKAVPPSSLNDLLSCLSPNFPSVAISVKSSIDVNGLWHCRLGHISDSRMKLIDDPVGYKLMDLSSKVVFLSRDVVFHETHFPFKSSSHSSKEHSPLFSTPDLQNSSYPNHSSDFQYSPQSEDNTSISPNTPSTSNSPASKDLSPENSYVSSDPVFDYLTLNARISGVIGVEVLAGLHWYLKYWCGSHISWDKTGGVQLNSTPKLGSLPRLQDDGILVQRPVPWNYYSNAVTSSYSFAWWDWKRWEKEIDWMALQGINLPLAFTGQEAIWQKAFQKFNISKEDLDDFFGGPAFLAWSRMANLHRWGGLLSQSWFDQQLILQKKILARMYELGMTPVLPAFSGNVPAALRNIFPSAKITRLGNWFSVRSDARWCCTYLLDATDPLFIEIGRAFIEQQLIEYGRTSHIYNCDTFDENTPPVDDPEYISSLGGSIFEGMQSGDSNAVWLMQGWLFSYDPFWRPPQTKALLHSVPIGRLVVLDLFAEVKPIWITSEQFYGVPYIWCMLHNFAGNLEMYGYLDSVASGPVEARTSENSTMVKFIPSKLV
ncbi:hypothetical protein DKX38_018645 [Salix brachista]|uniref:Alpha-N-acetylglucosaminidase tim-barrel domain-containing protein n=1 Tax=Salix brachista TaxID=2182728 RepID=A0A5N5KNK3_9ROSI|nr:hypothetical protein DKX38_018645 [Salix brachista]